MLDSLKSVGKNVKVRMAFLLLMVCHISVCQVSVTTSFEVCRQESVGKNGFLVMDGLSY